MNGYQPRDQRPANCRNRLRDEGQQHPKSGCASCGTGGITGCPHERRPEPPITGSGVIPPTTISKLTLACERLEAENTVLRDALEPVAARYASHIHLDATVTIFMKDCREAFMALHSKPDPVKPSQPPDTLGVIDGPAPRGKVSVFLRVGDEDYKLTGRTRIRTSWLGLAVFEEEWIRLIHEDLPIWRRVRGYRIISE